MEQEMHHDSNVINFCQYIEHLVWFEFEIMFFLVLLHLVVACVSVVCVI